MADEDANINIPPAAVGGGGGGAAAIPAAAAAANNNNNQQPQQQHLQRYNSTSSQHQVIPRSCADRQCLTWSRVPTLSNGGFGVPPPRSGAASVVVKGKEHEDRAACGALALAAIRLQRRGRNRGSHGSFVAVLCEYQWVFF